MYGAMRSTYVANAVANYNDLFLTSSYKVDIRVNDELFKTVEIDGDYLPIRVIFTAEELGLTSADAGS